MTTPAARAIFYGVSQATIQVREDPDGSVTHRLAVSPEGLPSVRGRDLAAAWDAAREAARDSDAAAAWARRRFVFDRADGSVTELALIDRDARCWAEAVGRVSTLSTQYGVSLCLRLLALVDLLARAPWASRLLAFEAGLARLHPALLCLAASSPLSAEARFDEARLRDTLASLPAV